MKRVGILGGTFDPPHIGHLIIADQVLQKCQLDEIRFMPNQQPPHKLKATNSTADDRVEMLKLATSDHPKFCIETIELERNGKSYTYDTMVLLKKKEPESQFYFIIGGDMVDYLPKFYKIDELIQLVKLIGVNRPNYEGKTTYPIQMVDIPSMNISSSMIRERLSNNDSVKYLLLDNVIHYIQEHGLYGKR